MRCYGSSYLATGAWIQTWLTQHSHCVVLNGEPSSPMLPVLSGVPQDTVLGSLMFTLHINDIVKDINSPLQLLTGDCCFME